MDGPHTDLPDLPIGKLLWDATQAISRDFDQALRHVGGSRSMWQILLTLKTRPVANQRELAAAIGIQGATLTHHLSAMEDDGLLTRRRDPENRRVHLVELTDKGHGVFRRVKDAAMEFDRRLRIGIPESDLNHLRHTLARLRANSAQATNTADSG